MLGKLLTFCLTLTAVQVNAQSADAIIDGYVNFIGGKGAWTDVKSIVTSGEYNYGGLPFPFTTYSKAPNLYKFIVPFNGKYYEQAFDGKKGWKIDAFKNETKVTVLSGMDAKSLANEADVELQSPLIDYAVKGHKATFLMKDTLGGRSCDVVRLVRKDGTSEDYYFDEQTYELAAKKATAKNSELKKAPLKIFYSDYRDVNGIKIPYKTICTSEEQTILTITLAEVKINSPVDNKEFRPK